MNSVKYCRGNIKGFAIVLLIVMPTLLCASARADVLQGRLEKDDQLYRLDRPSSGPSGSTLNGGAQQSTRIARPTANLGEPHRGLVDANAFSSPLQGQVGDNGLHSGLVKAGDFPPLPKNFDLGAERGSKELLLAWEKWHHQLSQAIYQRWSDRAESQGRATVKVTVTRDRVISAQILNSNGGPGFEASLMDAIEGLTGNPGLSFPAKSLRQRVSFEADYIASHDVTPGYNWIHNDYEHIRQEY